MVSDFTTFDHPEPRLLGSLLSVKEPAGLPVVEIFGPTIQGEGQLIGMPTMFIRFGGCDYRCSWCDSVHAVDKKTYGHTWARMSEEMILDELKRLSPKPGLITLSGGNPAIHDLERLINLGRRQGWTFAMETQGTFSAPWWVQVDYVTLSPKPPSSGMSNRFDRTMFEACLSWCSAHRTIIKIVIADHFDYEWAYALHREYPHYRMALQVANLHPTLQYSQWSSEHGSHIAGLMTSWEALTSWVLEDGWFDVQVLPQLHVLAWGNKQGV